MGQHRFIQGREDNVCWDCGINVVPANRDSCPPWSSTGGGENTNTNRAYGAGEFKAELNRIAERLVEIRRQKASPFIETKLFVMQCDLAAIIQKCDGHSKD